MAAVSRCSSCDIEVPIVLIDHFAELEQYELSQPENEKRKICVLDLDETVATADHKLISVTFSHLMGTFCRELGRFADSPFLQDWFSRFLTSTYFLNAPYGPTDENVARVIQRFQKENWEVHILTNRSAVDLDLAIKHLEQCRVHIPPGNIHCRPGGSQATKGERILKLIPELAKGVRVVFCDDDHRHCETVQGTLSGRAGIDARIYLYRTQPATIDALREIIVQLDAHERRVPLPSIVRAVQEVADAALRLNIKINPQDPLFASTFIDACLRVARKDKEESTGIKKTICV